MTFRRSCGIHDTLQLQRSDNVLALVIGILIVIVELNHIKAGRNNDRAVFFRDNCVFLCIVNRSCLTYFGAGTTFSCLKFDTALCIDDRHIRNCLCKRCVNRTSRIQSTVKFAWCLFGRTFLLTYATTGTFILIHIAGFFADIYGKISHEPRYLFDLAVCINIDFFMGRCLHHLRCENARGTVQRREGFVKLRHSSADTRCLLHNIYFIACICNIKCRLNSCDTAANNQRTFCHTTLAWLKRCVQIDFCNGCPRQNNRLFGGLFHVLVNPGAMLTDIGDLHHVWV